MQDYKKLKVWERGHKFCLEVYKTTNNYPSEEKFGITSQLRRAAVSIPTNIVEGSSRGSQKEFNRFLQIALGSASEVEYLLYLSNELNFFNQETFEKLNSEILEIKMMLSGLIRKINA